MRYGCDCIDCETRVRSERARWLLGILLGVGLFVLAQRAFR